MIHSPRSVSVTVEPLGFEIVIQEGFLGGHRLGLDDLFHIVVAGDAGDDRIGFAGCFGQMDVNARFGGIFFEFLEKRIHPRQCGILGGGNLCYQALHVHVGKGVGPAGTVSDRELVHSTAQERVLKSVIDFFLVFF